MSLVKFKIVAQLQQMNVKTFQLTSRLKVLGIGILSIVFFLMNSVLVKAQLNLISGKINLNGTELVQAGTLVYFNNYSTASGNELWRTDGTDAGTFMVTDMNPGSAHGYNEGAIFYNGALIFGATDATGPGLWKTDGTLAGTILIKRVGVGGGSYFVKYKGKLYFPGFTAEAGSELWTTDGTSNGTVMLTNPNGDKSSIYNRWTALVYGNELYFSADFTSTGASSRILYKYDGTNFSYFPTITIGGEGNNPMDFELTTNGFFFNNLNGLYKCDGATVGLVKTHASDGSIYDLETLDNARISFSLSKTGTTIQQLWVSDGTTLGTSLLKEMPLGSKGTLQQSGNRVFFNTFQNGNTVLAYSDGTINGTVVTNFKTNNGTIISRDGNIYLASTDNHYNLAKINAETLQETLIYNVPTVQFSSFQSVFVSDSELYFRTDYNLGQYNQGLFSVNVSSSVQSQTITFLSIPIKSVSDAPFTLNATASSSLPITYTSSNTNVATISDNTVTIVGAGTTDITASQVGNANYNAATNVVQTLTVNSAAKQNQTITFPAIATKLLGSGNFNITATASSSLPISYSSSNTSVASISGNTVTLVGTGISIITASQGGDATYNAAANVQQTLTIVNTAAAAPFNYKKIILGTTASTLNVSIQSKNNTNGQVSINGGDSQAPTTPFTWIWGDNTASSSFFPGTHTYSDVSKNYIVKVIANYSSTNKDTVSLLVDFVTPSVTPIALDTKTKVIIPSTTFSFAGTRLYAAPTLASFPDNIFTTYPRSTVEYILSVASSIGYDLVNSNIYLYNGKFEQYLLRNASFGGAYSIWYTNPVGFGSGDAFLNGDVDFSSLTHEMGHNYTLNSPANFYYGGNTDGNGAAIYSEAMAQMFAHTAGYEMINNAQSYGISDDMRFKLITKFNASAKLLRLYYNNYVSSGKHFYSWNDPATAPDETFTTFMTIAYKFMEHAESGNEGYKVPFKRMMTMLQKFNAQYKTLYASTTNSVQADAFRSTLMVAAVSSAFNADLRAEFIALNFPIDNAIFMELFAPVQKANQTITFSAIPAKTVGDGTFTLTASASSNLAVTYSSSNTAVAVISGSNISIAGAGTTTITASQEGNTNYNTAVDVLQTLTVNKAAQTIAFATLADKTLGDAPITLNATVSSSLAVSYSTASDKITIAGNQATLVKAGRLTITASQSGNSNFNAATSVDRSFCINPGKPVITTGIAGESVTLTSNSSTGNQWFKDGSAMSGATHTALSVTAAGVYKVQVSADDCKSEFSSDVPLIVTGDISVNSKTDFGIFPNPVDDVLYLSLPWQGIKLIQITQVDGKTMEKLRTENQKLSVPVTQYAIGQYFVLVQYDKGIVTGRFVKK